MSNKFSTAPVIISNAFSFNMIQPGLRASIEMDVVGHCQVQAAMGSNWKSAIGHEDLAAIASATAGISIPANRMTVILGEGLHRLLICQYQGPRLPEGAKELPEGASVAWLAVKVWVGWSQVGLFGALLKENPCRVSFFFLFQQT